MMKPTGKENQAAEQKNSLLRVTHWKPTIVAIETRTIR
jgi:hypothetical protein